MMMERFESLREAWWPRMQGMIDEVLTTSSPTGPDLARMTAYHLETGGKRLRAMLPLLVAEALDVPAARLLPFGAACEMLHNATLVHDDLQDGDAWRRGRPTVWNRFGMPQAVNVGDAMFYWTLMLVSRVEATAEVRQKATERVVHETLRVIDGQAQEFALKERPRVSVLEYLRMVDGKTSGLFSLPMAGAAVLCGADDATVEGLAEASRHLGVLFQIQDDVLDLYGEKGREKIGNDLREGKRSLLVVHALATLEGDEASWLRAVVDAPRDQTSDDDVAAAINLLTRCGALDRAISEIERRRQFARLAVRDSRLVALIDGLSDVLLSPIQPLLRQRAAVVTEADMALCAELLPRVSRTFALSISMLPEALRGAVQVSYLLCRVLDTIEDDFSAPQAVREALFDAVERLLDDDGASTAELAATGSLLGGSADETALMAGVGAVFRAWWSLPTNQRAVIRPWLLEMSFGMRSYVRRRAASGALRLDDLADLEAYCGYVAGTVGALLTGLFRLVCPTDHVAVPLRGDAGWRFGLGLQLVNILKDVAEDAERGVCWLPRDLLAAEGLQPSDLLAPEHRDAAMRVVHTVAARARQHLEEAVRYVSGWPAEGGRDVRLFCAVPLALALRTLDEVERGPDTLAGGRSPKVSRAEVGAVLESAVALAGEGGLEAWLRGLTGDARLRGAA